MQLISIEELINHKILPYDIYNEQGNLIFSAGEIMTPGKILQLKYIPAIYIDDPEDEFEFVENDFEIIDETVDEIDIEQGFPEEIEDELIEKDESDEIKINEPDFLKKATRVVLPEKTKTEIKTKYKDIMDSFIEEGAKDPSICLDVRDTIIKEIIPEVHKILYKSQLKVYGEYHYSHGINVAMLSTVLAHKLKLKEQLIKDITLAAMLHDIGKTRIPEEILYKPTLTSSELKLIQLHPKIGYNIIKNELNLSENIARVALQHHERRDGTGYPFGTSGDKINTETSIVSICNVYDKLTSGKGEIKVKNSKEAIKYILEIGSKQFRSDVLYTFVHMTNYNDNTPVASVDFGK